MIVDVVLVVKRKLRDVPIKNIFLSIEAENNKAVSI